MPDFKVYNILLDEAYQKANVYAENLSEFDVDQNVVLNNTYYYTYKDSDNPEPACPTGFVNGNPICLPSQQQINQNTFNSNTAILSLYFIQSFVYMFKNYSPTGTMQPSNTLLPYDGSTGTNNTNISTIQNYLSNAKISSVSPTCANMLTYISQSSKTTFDVPVNSYGGCILEYSINGQLTSFIVLRGTQLDSEWYEDSRVDKVKTVWLGLDTNAKVHHGFNDVYNDEDLFIGSTSLRDQINNYLTQQKISQITNLIITGHSLGSGIAYLIAADISKNNPSLRSKTKFFPFAGPYSGNQQFVDFITNTKPTPPVDQLFAVINKADPVPTIQLPFYERIPSQLFFFTDKGTGGAYPHLPSTYRKNLELAASTFNTIGTNNSITYTG
jgi:hypothetical protein